MWAGEGVVRVGLERMPTSKIVGYGDVSVVWRR